jgi:adenylate kinase
MITMLYLSLLLMTGPAFAQQPAAPQDARCELYLASSAMPRRIVLMGAPGSGKSNLGKRLSKFLGVPHLSTGDMIRAEIAAGTSFGLRMAEVVRTGGLDGEDEVLEYVVRKLTSPQFSRGYVMEGYPRTPGAAERLEARLAVTDRPLDQVILIEVPNQVLMERLNGRGRADDTPEIIARRLADYHALTLPNVAYYERRGILSRVVSGGTADDTANRALRILEERAVAAELLQQGGGTTLVDLMPLLPSQPWFHEPVYGVTYETHLRGVSIPVGMPSVSGQLGVLVRAVEVHPRFYRYLGFSWDARAGRLTIPLPSTFQCLQTLLDRMGFLYTPRMQAHVSFTSLASWVAFISNAAYYAPPQ